MSASVPMSHAGLLGAPLTRRAMLTACTGAGLTGLYGLYATFVTPLVIPGQSEAVVSTGPPPPPPPENVRMAEQYLPSQPWAAEAKYQFRTAEAFVYANEWEPVENNQAVRFRPFAMIFLSSSRKPGQAPVTLVGEWAFLRFEKKFDVNDPDPGRVVYASLQGKVRVSGPENLVIAGRNFTFSEESRKLWSDERVAFQYEGHRGQGLGLEAFLIADETATQSESIAITGVQSIRLRKNVAMELSFPRDEGRDRRDRETAPVDGADGAGKTKPDKPDEPIEISVRSTGSFEYDIEAGVGTFSDLVRVYRPTGVDDRGRPQHDSLLCEQLTLSFEPKLDEKALAEAEARRAAAAAGEVLPDPQPPAEGAPLAQRELKDGQREGNFRNIETRLELRRARARGKPGKPVVLISEANNLTAQLSDLIYDVPTRVAALTSPEKVHVRQGTSELRSPGVTLQHDERGRVTSVRCQGPGHLVYRDPETNVLELAAQWQRQLRKYSDPETGLDVIELELKALVRQPEDKTGLAAEFIKLWMDPQDLRAARSDDARGKPADRVRLRKLLAQRDVALVSPEMHGKTNRLEVTFEESPRELPPPPMQSSEALQREAPRVQPGAPWMLENARTKLTRVRAARPGAASSLATGNATRPRALIVRAESTQSAAPRVPQAAPWVLPAAAHFAVEDAVEKSDGPDEPDGSLKLREGDGPIQVYSDLIRVRAIQGKTQRESRMAEVWTEGNVEVTQEHGDDEEPLVLTGDKLHLENRSEADQVLHVSGAPAHIYDRGMHIEGRNVHLDRVSNKAWVDGAGLLQLQVKSGLNGEKLDAAQLLDVWWKEKMTFDGEFARFFGDVRTVLNESKMHCEAMEVKLTERISFTAAEQDRTKAKIETVDCRDGVRFDSMEYAVNAEAGGPPRLSEVRRGHVARFTLDQITGNTQAHGPGHIEFWRKSNGSRPGLGVPGLGPNASRATGPTSSGSETGAADSDAEKKDAAVPHWEYTRVEFAGRSDGNIQQRFTKFEERVHVLYGPVDKPPDTVDPDELPKEGGWMECDSLKIQQVLDETPGEKPGRATKLPRASATSAAAPAAGSTAAGSSAAGEPKPKPQGHVELLAQGNVDLFGRTFSAKADEVSYDESKGMYILRSLGRANAVLYRQKQVGGDSDKIEARTMHFWPGPNDRKFHIVEAAGATGAP